METFQRFDIPNDKICVIFPLIRRGGASKKSNAQVLREKQQMLIHGKEQQKKISEELGDFKYRWKA